MTDIEFLEHAEALLNAIEFNCDRFNDSTDVDIDNQRVGAMLTLTFTNRSQIVINLQKPLQEVWMATQAGGFHYQYKGGLWLDTKGHGEFFAQLSACASKQSGLTLVFTD